MSFYARPCEIHALNRICPHGDCVKVVKEIDVAQLAAALEGLLDAVADTMRSHQKELECCSVTRVRMIEARAALAKLGAK